MTGHRLSLKTAGGDWLLGAMLPRSNRGRLGVSLARRIVAALAVGLSFCPYAEAIIVGTTPNVVPATAVNPASYSGWTQGDPGWANVTQSGATSSPSYVYLGDNWVLSARHVGVWTANFEVGSFSPIPGQNFVIKNPPPPLAGGLSLTTESDLRLVRISGNPGLPSLTIASQSPSLNSEVMMIGDSNGRQAAETQWNITVRATPDADGSPHWTWTETGSGTYQGYKSSGPTAKRWGTNHLANPSNFSSAFDETLSSTTGVTKVSNRDVIAMVSKYDKNSSNDFEAQAISGDSGGAVFRNFGTQASPEWKLAGILNAVLVFEDQPTGWGVYNDATVFSDLSYYNKAYDGSICDVMKVCGDYSIMGDVNLDNVVSGDGTGAWDVDDVTAFVEGWGYDNLAGAGDYDSWSNGDLNLDGKTDVNDFFKLRNALNGSISATVLSTLFGGGSPVPEPSAVALVTMVAALFALGARFRRPRRVR